MWLQSKTATHNQTPTRSKITREEEHRKSFGST